MTAIFKEQMFNFGDGQPVPEHIEGHPDEHRDQRREELYHIEGFHEPDGDFYWLAINIETPDDAAIMLQAALSRIEIEERETEQRSRDGVAIVGPNDEGAYSAMGAYWQRRHSQREDLFRANGLLPALED